MIPTLIVLGLCLGLAPAHWERRVPVTLAIIILVSLAWGLLVEAPFGGALLALVNLGVGVGIGLACQIVSRALRRQSGREASVS